MVHHPNLRDRLGSTPKSLLGHKHSFEPEAQRGSADPKLMGAGCSWRRVRGLRPLHQAWSQIRRLEGRGGSKAYRHALAREIAAKDATEAHRDSA
jgi:hypothetical protein